VVTYIKEIGGGHKGLAIKAGYSRNCYYIPATKFQEVPEIDEPIQEGEPL
jgi:phage terminase small subunit